MTEGTRTETQYVDKLSQYMKSTNVRVKVSSEGVGKDPVAVVRQAMQRRDDEAKKGRPFEACFCLVDVDQHQNLRQAITLAKANGIYLLVSSLKFETWLIWHVDGSRKAWSSRQLDELAKKHNFFVRGKNLDPKFPIEEVQHAVKVARLADPDLAAQRIGPDPSSAMPVLVEYLRSQS